MKYVLYFVAAFFMVSFVNGLGHWHWSFSQERATGLTLALAQAKENFLEALKRYVVAASVFRAFRCAGWPVA